MITFWNRHEVYMGLGGNEFYQVRRILAKSGIKYTWKIMRYTSYVYVHKKDAEEAQYVIQESKR